MVSTRISLLLYNYKPRGMKETRTKRPEQDNDSKHRRSNDDDGDDDGDDDDDD